MIVLVDSNYVCHYSMHAGKGLSFRGSSTGVIFNFLRQVYILAKKFESNRFVFAWDSRKSIRRIRYGEYKQKPRDQQHEKTPEERQAEAIAFSQFEKIREEVLPKMGFKNNFLQVGHEGDDIMASVCFDNPDEKIAMISADHDLYQLLTSKHFLYNLRNRKKYTDEDFRKEWGIDPEQWGAVKTISGCQTDNVRGIEGVGDKKAVKYLLGKLPEKGKIVKRIESKEGQELMFDNQFLVILPMPGTLTYKLRKDHLTLPDFLEICDEYGFNSFKAQEQIWRERFNMKLRRTK